MTYTPALRQAKDIHRNHTAEICLAPITEAVKRTTLQRMSAEVIQRRCTWQACEGNPQWPPFVSNAQALGRVPEAVQKRPEVCEKRWDRNNASQWRPMANPVLDGHSKVSGAPP